MELNNPHDKFFKELFADKQRAADILQGLLPKSLTSQLNFETIETQNGSFITNELKEYFSDTILKLELKNKKHCYINLLLEHKSYKDEMVPLQLLLYLGNAYYSQLKRKQSLALIIPIIYYHGTTNWEINSIESLFSKYPDDLLQYIPKFKIQLIDLAALSDTELISLAGNMLSSPLLLQKYATDAEALSNNIIRILSTLNPYLKKNFLKTIFVYSTQIINLSKEEISEVLNKLPKPIKEDFMTTYEILIQSGKKEGLVEGKKEGLMEGKKEGLVEGKKEGLVEGKKEGLVEGKKEGLVEGQKTTVENCFKEGLSIELAIKISELPEHEVRSIYTQLKNSKIS